MSLRSTLFQGNARVEKASQNAPPFKLGESSDGVGRLQRALIKLGYAMPVSTAKTGAPDGIFGAETQNRVRAFQLKEGLSADGIAGRNTIARLDDLLVKLEFTPVHYFVPGMKHLIEQPTQCGCWATSYTMMVCWKKQICLEIEQALEQTPMNWKWKLYYNANKGLPPYENIPFARDTGMKHQGLMCLDADGWLKLLQRHGLLWVVYGWMVFGANGSPVRGRHAIVLEGITGDGTPDATWFSYLDPWDGERHSLTYREFNDQFEMGFDFGGTVQMIDVDRNNFSQILYYP